MCDGVYLFEDDDTGKAYLDSELFPGVKTHPALSDVKTKACNILPDHLKITRAPI